MCPSQTSFLQVRRGDDELQWHWPLCHGNEPAIDPKSSSTSLIEPRLISAPSCKFQITSKSSFSKEEPHYSMLPSSKIFSEVEKVPLHPMWPQAFGLTSASLKPRRYYQPTISQLSLPPASLATTTNSVSQANGERSTLIPHLSITVRMRLSMDTNSKMVWTTIRAPTSHSI